MENRRTKSIAAKHQGLLQGTKKSRQLVSEPGQLQAWHKKSARFVPQALWPVMLSGIWDTRTPHSTRYTLKA